MTTVEAGLPSGSLEVDVLRLEAYEVQDQLTWRWRLRDGAGAVITDSGVLLDAESDEYAAFLDPYGILQERLPETGKKAYEKAFVEALGDWIGERIFGGLTAFFPDEVIVVSAPADGAFLRRRPLELCRIDGRSLAEHHTVLVHDTGSAAVTSPRAADEEIRILAIYSLPDKSAPLNLRRERYALESTVRRLNAVRGKYVTLEVLQYGATRDSITAAVEEYPGWDIVHVSAHGTRGELFLETEDGDSDVVTAAELAGILRPTRNRVQLCVLSACYSGTPGHAAQGSLVEGIAATFRCATLAMRFPVRDGFAVTLMDHFYTALLDRQQPVAEAVRLALPKALDAGLAGNRPAISAGTLALFGSTACTVRFPRPGTAAKRTGPVGTPKLSGRFPLEPQEFVGRCGILTLASAALAARSPRRVVWLAGVAGAGKSWCAAELSHRHAQSFGELAWWAAPREIDDFRLVMADLCRSLSEQLGWPPDWASSMSALRSWLPQLRGLLRDSRVLLVLDEMQSLLTPSKQWRDDRLQHFVSALRDHGGMSRSIIVARQPAAPVQEADADDPVLHLTVKRLSFLEIALRLQSAPRLGRHFADVDRDADVRRMMQDGGQAAVRLLAFLSEHPSFLGAAANEVSDGSALPDVPAGPALPDAPEDQPAARLAGRYVELVRELL